MSFMHWSKSVLIVGLVVLGLAILAYGFTTTDSAEFLGAEVEETDTPYRDYALPLAIGGIVLLVVGGFGAVQEAPRR